MKNGRLLRPFFLVGGSTNGRYLPGRSGRVHRRAPCMSAKTIRTRSNPGGTRPLVVWGCNAPRRSHAV